MTQLILDALWPGTPAQLVAACRSVGAAGAWVYVWHGSAQSYDTGGCTKAHADALRAAGLIAAPVASGTPGGPGGMPTPQQIVAAAEAWGFTSGPIAMDMESPANLPSEGWWQNAMTVYRQDHFKADEYGNQGDVGTYPVGDGWWQARYIQQTVQPVPSLPSGLAGWQYANSVDINGIGYDISVFDPAVFAVRLVGDIDLRVIQALSSTTPNPNPVYVTDSQTKRWISNGDEQNFYLALCGQTGPQIVTQWIVDRLPAIASPGVSNPPSFGAPPIDLLKQRDQVNQAANASTASGPHGGTITGTITLT